MKKVKEKFQNRLKVLAYLVMAIAGIMLFACMEMNKKNVGTVAMAGITILAVPKLAGKSLDELKEERGEALKEYEKIISDCETEKRDLKPEEITRRDELIKYIESIKNEIRLKEILEEEKRNKANSNFNKKIKEGNPEDREIANYSVVKAIRDYSSGGKLEGLELELDQEARKEAAKSGIAISGIGVPASVLNSIGRRALSATGTTTTTLDQGGISIQTSKVDFIDVLRSRMVMAQLGVQFLGGLIGNISIPKKTTAGTASWAAENADPGETSQLFGSVDMSPKRLATWSQYSKQLIAQSSLDVENLVRVDLETAIRLAVEAAAINGSGSSNQPKGILNVSGIGSVVGGTNGAAPTWQNIIDLETAVAAKDADIATLGYLINPKVRGKLKSTVKVSGYPEYIWNDAKNEFQLNGYNAAVTSNVPSTLTKGTSNGVCSAAIFGNFSELIIAQWAGLDLTVDPFSQAKLGRIVLIVNSFWDVAVRHPESFSAMVDMLTT